MTIDSSLKKLPTVIEVALVSMKKKLRTLEVTTAAKCGSVKSAEIRPAMKIKDSDAKDVDDAVTQ